MSLSVVRLVADRLMLISRLLARRRSRALVERDLPARRSPRRKSVTVGSGFHCAEMVERGSGRFALSFLLGAACVPMSLFLSLYLSL